METYGLSEEDDPDHADEACDDEMTAEELAAANAEIVNDRRRRRAVLEGLPSLKEFLVDWDTVISADLVARFRQALDGAKVERDLQIFLEDNPTLLVQPLGGGHGRWVLPQKRLGGEHITDFMIAEKSSLGFEWTAVELESPTASIFTKAGEFSATASHAIRQIEDWRIWLGRNRDYATRPRDQSGLGLIDIDANVPGWIIIGRRSSMAAMTADRRRERSQKLGIRIHSYDWLLDRAEARIQELR